ncbi:hypothetical protein AB0F81_07605 [Actinoplanes sp. NPDC024001]|uniref:hypothetical protein n=1 Tax=Actinoplanes sp. NPDC024001 TaxID=3154598 RepID=UPI0033C36F17
MLAFSAFARFDPRHRAAMQAVARHAVDPPPEPAFAEMFQDAGRLRAAVGEAGFAGTDVQELTVRSEFRDVDHFVAWLGSHSARDLLRRVPARRRPDLLAELATVLPDPPELSTTVRLITARRPA